MPLLVPIHTHLEQGPGDPGPVLHNVVEVGDEGEGIDPPARQVRLQQDVHLPVHVLGPARRLREKKMNQREREREIEEQQRQRIVLTDLDLAIIVDHVVQLIHLLVANLQLFELRCPDKKK